MPFDRVGFPPLNQTKTGSDRPTMAFSKIKAKRLVAARSAATNFFDFILFVDPSS